MQIYPHKAKINANIASIYAIINPKNAPESCLLYTSDAADEL